MHQSPSQLREEAYAERRVGLAVIRISTLRHARLTVDIGQAAIRVKLVRIDQGPVAGLCRHNLQRRDC